MGYACPVCGTPQADERHLADHLAVRAMTHGDDHEAWLDERVPDWSDLGPHELGGVVAEEAAETDYPQVFENTTSGHDHDHGGDRAETLEDHLAEGGHRGPGAGGRGDLTAEQRAVVERAREMTREMMEGRDGDGDGDDEQATETRDDEDVDGGSAATGDDE